MAQNVSRPVLAGRSARLRIHHGFARSYADHGCVLFWDNRSARLRHLEVGNKLATRLHPSCSTGGVPRSWVRALYALVWDRFLARRISFGSVFRLLSPQQLGRKLGRFDQCGRVWEEPVNTPGDRRSRPGLLVKTPDYNSQKSPTLLRPLRWSTTAT